MATAKRKKMVMVGCRSLSADIVKLGDPILYAEIVEVSGRGLEYAENKLYTDTLGNKHNMFVDVDSAIARRVLGLDEDDKPVQNTRRRRRA